MPLRFILKKEAKKKEASQNVDQLAVEAIKLKMSSPTISANIRIITSAENELIATQIISDIESKFGVTLEREVNIL